MRRYELDSNSSLSKHRYVRHCLLSGITKVNNQNQINWGGYLTLIRTVYFLNVLLVRRIQIIFKGHTSMWERNRLKQKETFKNFLQILCILSVNTTTVFPNRSKPLPSAFPTHFSCSTSTLLLESIICVVETVSENILKIRVIVIIRKQTWVTGEDCSSDIVYMSAISAGTSYSLAHFPSLVQR